VTNSILPPAFHGERREESEVFLKSSKLSFFISQVKRQKIRLRTCTLRKKREMQKVAFDFKKLYEKKIKLVVFELPAV
jgi:hypothetical protein